jgi:hypothetical protein
VFFWFECFQCVVDVPSVQLPPCPQTDFAAQVAFVAPETLTGVTVTASKAIVRSRGHRTALRQGRRDCKESWRAEISNME